MNKAIVKTAIAIAVFFLLMKTGDFLAGSYERPSFAFFEDFGGMMAECNAAKQIPPPAVCYVTDKGLLFDMASANIGTAVCYLLIPILLVIIVWGRVNWKWGLAISLFGGFVLSCGNVHWAMVKGFWEAGNETALLFQKNIMEVLSAATVSFLAVNIGYFRKIESPEAVKTKLLAKEKQNDALQSEIVRLRSKNEALLSIVEQQEVIIKNRKLTEQINKLNNGKS